MAQQRTSDKRPGTREVQKREECSHLRTAA
jgi:hypothetical protein